MFLGDLVEINAGFITRGKPDYSESGEYFLVRLQDVLECGILDWDNMHRINAKEVKPSCFIKDGDILFRAKGFVHDAVMVNREDGKAIASAQFFILRVINEQVLPEYIAWYINQKPAQDYFKLISAGTSIPSVNKQNLLALDIKIPESHTQKAIANVYRLHQKEQVLIDEIRRKKSKLIHALLLKAVMD